MKEDYRYPLKLTAQFRFCGNPLSLDFTIFAVLGVNIALQEVWVDNKILFMKQVK